MSNKNPKLWKKAQELAAKGYTTIISEDILSTGEKVYLAEHPELEGCMTQGNSVDEAVNDLKQITVDFIYYMLEDGLNIPEPVAVGFETITGSWGIALSKELKTTVTISKNGSFSAEEENSIADLPSEEGAVKSMQFTIIEGLAG